MTTKENPKRRLSRARHELVNGARIVCYDNGGKTADRYTVVYIDDHYDRHTPNLYECVGMNASPFHPQGIGQHSAARLGRHLGKRITFAELPADCQKLVRQDTKHQEAA